MTVIIVMVSDERGGGGAQAGAPNGRRRASLLILNVASVLCSRLACGATPGILSGHPSAAGNLFRHEGDSRPSPHSFPLCLSPLAPPNQQVVASDVGLADLVRRGDFIGNLISLLSGRPMRVSVTHL